MFHADHYTMGITELECEGMWMTGECIVYMYM